MKSQALILRKLGNWRDIVEAHILERLFAKLEESINKIIILQAAGVAVYSRLGPAGEPIKNLESSKTTLSAFPKGETIENSYPRMRL